VDRVSPRAAQVGDEERSPARSSERDVDGPARRRDVAVDGVRLETATLAGDPARAAIVLLHEGLGSVSLWRDVPQRLRARTGRTVVAYSRRGYGGSDPLDAKREPSFMHVEATRVLPALLRELRLERPIVFGHSDGASIALLFAGAFPDALSGLILEAPHVFVEDLSVRSIETARRAYETTDLRAKLARHHADVDGAFYGWNDVWLDPRFRDWNIEDAASAVRVPLLLIQGENDEYGTLAQIDAIAARAPQADILVVSGAGHSPHRDDPDLIVERVGDFVDRLGPSSGGAREAVV